MPRVYYALPSARPPEEAGPNLRSWQVRGYAVLIQRDMSAPDVGGVVNMHRPYSGYAEAVNYLVKYILANDSEAEWIVTGGDDTLPDQNHTPDQIADSCHVFFCGTFGVMQPTGDDFGSNPNHPDPTQRGSYISRVAGSPWLGRQWCRRINQGNGPLWEEYYHCGEDEETQAVAIKHGVFWQRPDLTHHHNHWARPRTGERMAPSERMPAFLARANSPEEWRRYKAIFARRQAAGFPGSDPIL